MSHLGTSPNNCCTADLSGSWVHLPWQLTAAGTALYFFALNFFPGQLAGVL